MTKNNLKKIIAILIIAIFATAFILYFQIKKIKQISIEMAEKPLIDYHFTPIKTSATDPLLGNPGAPVTIIEFLDINSAESRKLHEKLTTFIKQKPQTIRLIVLDFPHFGFFTSSNNLRPHLATRCAFEQNSKLFFDYLEAVQKIEKNLTNDNVLEEIASSLNINIPIWKLCMDSEDTKTKINQSIELGHSIGLRKAPVVFINNKRINYLTDIKIEDLLTEIMREYK